MNNMKKHIPKKLLLFFLVFSATFPCQAQSINSFIGKWFAYELSFTYTMIFEFTANQLIILNLADNEKEIYDYEIRNNKMIFKNHNDPWGFEFLDRNTIKFTVVENNPNFLFCTRIDRQVTSLSGKFYLANNVGFLKMIEIIDSSILCLYYDVLDMKASYLGEYRISGSHIVITANNGTLILELIGDSIIKGDTLEGVGSIFGEEGDSIFLKE